jgi:hypothetical protein
MNRKSWAQTSWEEALGTAREMVGEAPWLRRESVQRKLRLTFPETVQVWEALIEEQAVPDDREERRRAALDRYADAAQNLRWYQQTGSSLPHFGLSGPSDARQVAEDTRQAALHLGATDEQLQAATLRPV